MTLVRRAGLPDSRHVIFRPFCLQTPYDPLSLLASVLHDKLPFLAGVGFTTWAAGSPVRSGRIEFMPFGFADWSFTSCCSPPYLAVQQLHSVTGGKHLPGEDLHLSDLVRSQAHSPAIYRWVWEKKNVMSHVVTTERGQERFFIRPYGTWIHFAPFTQR